MADVLGTCDDRFAALRDVLARQLDSGADLGASVAVVLDGELVVDLWGGWADPERTRPWQADTIVNVWSTTKTMTNLSALVLVDRGELDVHAPVAHYWPEFAANGKHEVEVRHLLSHTSGVSAWAKPVTTEDLYDEVEAAARLAGQDPWWVPGTASGYHAISQGHLVGEVIRRITGQRLGDFFAKEVAGPLDGDFHIGLPPEHDDRVAPVVPPPPLGVDLSTMPDDHLGVRTLTGPQLDAAAANTEPWRRAHLGAVSGHGNARSVARIQSVVSHGGEVDGVRLLSPGTIDQIFEVQSDGADLVLGLPLRFGVGYALPQPVSFPFLPDDRICLWGGWGGSMVVNDLDRRMTLAYMMNRMRSGIIGNDTSEALIRAAYAALDVPVGPAAG